MSSAVINSADFHITSARDENVGAFYTINNKKLEHLPKNIGEKFPNLTILNVRDCSVKEITKESFKGLDRLQYLWLPGNRIERIDDDTFDYVPAVQSIDLRE